MNVIAALDDTEGESTNIIDKSKVTKEKQKLRNSYVDLNDNANIVSIYFYGRKDGTVLMEG